MKVREILTEEEFSKEVEGGVQPTIVDFYATWCAPCRMIAPIMDELSAEYSGSVSFFKVDVDKLPSIAQKYRIMGVPTIVFFRNGKEIGRSVGAASKQYFKEKIKNTFGI